MAPISSEERVQSRNHVIIAVVASFLILSWIAVSLRVWVRRYMIKSFGWDDATMVLTLILFTVYCSALLVIVRYGGGTHLTNLKMIQQLIGYVIANEALYIACTIFLKISLGISFLRIVVRRWQTYMICTIIAITTVYGVFYMFIAIFQCGLPNDFLMHKLDGNKCLSNKLLLVLAYTHAAILVIGDGVFATLPVVVLRSANMDLRAKISVGFIMMLGVFGSISSIIRFRYIDGIVTQHDFFFNAVNIATWSTVEPGSGIIAGSLATLRPLLRRTIQSARTTISSTSSKFGRSNPTRSRTTLNSQPSLSRGRTPSHGGWRILNHPEQSAVETPGGKLGRSDIADRVTVTEIEMQTSDKKNKYVWPDAYVVGRGKLEGLLTWR